MGCAVAHAIVAVMRARATIFDSHAERDLFQAIAGAWEPDYHVYPHVPFANLVDLDPHLLAAAELSFLHKTTVDFVLVTPEGRPCLAVEFDGLGRGLSRNGRYVQGVATPKDKARGWKLDLKVRVAQAAAFPLVVVSYDEGAHVDPESNLTILHAIIGGFLTSRAIPARFQQLVDDASEWLATLPAAERDEEIQDILIGVEVETEMRWNPVVRRAAELSQEIDRLIPVKGHSWRYEEDPPRPASAYPFGANYDHAVLQEWWSNVRRFGCTYTIETLAERVTETTWLRNFDAAGISPFGLLDEVAKLVTASKTLALVRDPDRAPWVGGRGG